MGLYYNTYMEVNRLTRNMTPDEKFNAFRDIEKAVEQLKHEFYTEWTWCGGCHVFVRIDQRTKEINELGKLMIKCGNCGCIHHIYEVGDFDPNDVQ